MIELRIYIVSGMNPEIPAAGGVRPYVLGIARGLHQRGVDVTIVGVGPGSATTPFNFESVNPRFPLSNYDFIRSLWIWARRHPLEPGAIVHAQRPDDLYPFVGSAQGNPLLCTLHGDPSRGVKERRKVGRILYGLAERRALKAASRVISVSYSGMEVYAKRYPWLRQKMSVIPVGIDLGVYRPLDRESSRSAIHASTRPTLLFAGRLEPEKRIDVLLDAVKGMKRPCAVVVAGDGTMGTSLRKRYADERITFLGSIPGEDMPVVYSAADALVLPSAFEGMPTVALEALACGTPVVATRVGDLPRIVRDGQTGYLFDGTATGLRDTIENHISALELLRPACENAGQAYGWEPVLDRILGVYADLAG